MEGEKEMLKVFLVEDEIIMRNGIKNKIAWEREGFAFVGEAADGELAYPLIKKTEPDILITDIKMPFMDGLELSRIIKKEMPWIKIIILSGYDEFDYAKQAITIGVTEYLLKPVSSAKLLETVKEVADIITKEREYGEMVERYKREMQENIVLERQKLFSDLVSNRLSTAELLDKSQKLEIDFTASVYVVMLFKAMVFQENPNYSEVLANVSKEVYQSVEKEPHILIFERATEGWAIIFKGDDEKQIEELIEKEEKILTEVIKSFKNVEYFAGIGSQVQRMRDINQSYQLANKAFSARFFMEWNQFVHYSDVGKIHSSGTNGQISLDDIRSNHEKRALVEEFLKNGTREEVVNFVDEYFLSIGEENYKSLMFRQYIVIDMFMSAVSFLEGMGLDTNSLSEEARNINEATIKAISVENIKYHLGRLFEEVLTLRDEISRRKYTNLVEEAKRYIDDNYQNDNISLNLVASHVNMSPSYFSTVFSQENGHTFTEYLTQIRINKAKELLMCTNMRTSEIGYEVGYRDSHYFSYIFKKIQGCTPRDYRTRGRA